MMKKLYIKLIAAVIVLSTAYSCSADWLDLKPSDAATREDALKTLSDAEVVLNGVYYMIKGTGNTTNVYYRYYGAGMIYYGDVKADDVQKIADNTGRVTWAYEMTYTASTATATSSVNMWQVPYMVIRRANTLIKGLDESEIEDATTEDINNLKGQALMARGLAHFDLLRLYSLPYEGANFQYGIPIVIEPSDPSSEPGRATVEETYTQIIQDLKDATGLMKSKNDPGYFNSWSAKALLARVYLYKGDYTNAYSTAVDVIENGPYRLWTNAEYTSNWGDPQDQNASEALFEISITSNDDWTDREGIAYLYNEIEGYHEAIITKSLYDLMTEKYAGDVRWGLLKESTKYGTAETYLGKKVWINKYPGRKTETDFRIGNIKILRLSETYLIASEAALKLSDKTNAAKYLNSIILRGNPDATSVTADNITLDRILQERRVELFGEGHRFFDLIRNNMTITRYTREQAESGNIDWHTPLNTESQSFDRTYFRAVLPIPQVEMDANRTIALQQNPGY